MGDEKNNKDNVVQLRLPNGRKSYLPVYSEDIDNDFIDYSTAPDPSPKLMREIKQEYWGTDKLTNRADILLNPHLRRLRYRH